jgi:hypothetical protein
MLDLHLNSYSIIGKESQTIHITLHKNEKININKKYLISTSSQELSERIYKNIDSIVENLDENEYKNQNIKKVDSSFIVNIKNKNSNIEYLSLSRGGKIMKIMPCFYNNLFLRLDCLLAFNNGIDLYTDKKMDEEINTTFPFNTLYLQNNIKYFIKNNPLEKNIELKYKFCLVKTKLNNEIETDNFDSLANSFLFNKSNLINDMIFISGRRKLLEKRLGEGESMVLLAQSLIGFEGSISFRQVKDKNGIRKYTNSLNDIYVDGPGLILFEPCERLVPMINNNKKYALIGLTILFIVLQLIFQFMVLDNF